MLSPWDLLGRLDVFRDQQLFKESLSAATFTHWEPNSATFSRVRERPIPGMKNPPAPLRNELFPEGIPEVLASMSSKTRKRLSADTAIAEMAARECLKSHRAGKWFGLEHPEGSLARFLRSWKQLEAEPGVMVTRFHACMFHPCKRRKRQILIHNVEALDQALNRICLGNRKCSRTGSSHLTWNPVVRMGKVETFGTGDEKEHPLEFCQSYARGVASLASKQGGRLVFLECYSAPRAPLSAAVAVELGTPPPKPYKGERPTRNVPKEMDDSRAIPASCAFPCAGSEPGALATESNAYRLSAVEAGRQPSYGKRAQLIPDGLNDPGQHIARAKTLGHPFHSSKSLKEDHRSAIEHSRSHHSSLTKKRLAELSRLKSLDRELCAEQKRDNERASWTARKLGLRPKTALMRHLQGVLGIEDTDVPEACLIGLPILGKAARSPFFEEFEVPPKMSKREFLGRSRSQQEAMLDRVRAMAHGGTPQLAKAIHEKTVKEVKQGTMGPPMSMTDVLAKYGSDFNIVPSFGLEQGVDQNGDPKFRRIDDHTASGNNLVAHRMQKVPMAMVDYVAVMVKAAHLAWNRPLRVATEDMKGAYRQVPLLPEHVRYSITAVYDPHWRDVKLYEIYGQPFGAGHAVPNFCRVAEWLARCACRLFQLLIDHFFDDFFLIEEENLAETAVWCLREFFGLMGFKLDPSKSQPPAQIAAVLGVHFCVQGLLSQRFFLVQAKPSRVLNLTKTIDHILKKDTLSSAEAASLIGKFGFLCSTLFGKVGRCCTAALRQRQYSSYPDNSLSEEIRASLRLMRCFLQLAPDRRVWVESAERPLLLYTDASDVPDRVPQRALGACLIDPSSQLFTYTSCEVPQTVVDTWLPKKSHMGQLELLAAVLALDTWQRRLAEASVLLFIDNDSAAANLVKGYSAKSDSAAIVGQFWLLAAHLQLSVYIDRVESKSNPSDGPSRLDFQFMHEMGASWTDPSTGQLDRPSVHPAIWFGATNDSDGGGRVTAPSQTTGGEKCG